MGWNPVAHDYCYGCSHYEAVGTYPYELKSSLAKRKCKHLTRCGRVANFVEKMELGTQVSLNDITSQKKGL